MSRIIDISFCIEDLHQCNRALLDIDTIEKIEICYIPTFHQDVANAGWKVTLKRPMRVFNDYSINEFFLDTIKFNSFVRQFSEALNK